LLGHCGCSLYRTQTMLQAGCQRRGDGHHRTCGLQLRAPHLASWPYRLEKAGDPRAAIAGGSLASTMLARSKSARCLTPPSQTASWLRPRSRRRRNDVGGRIIIGNIRGEPLANDVGSEQTLNIGKAGQIAQKVAPSPGSAVSSVTSAHDVTRSGSCPNPRLLF
jgi:hypothetical protein